MRFTPEIEKIRFIRDRESPNYSIHYGLIESGRYRKKAVVVFRHIRDIPPIRSTRTKLESGPGRLQPLSDYTARR